MTSSTPPAAAPSGGRTPLQLFADAFERETATTVRVVRAYPDDRMDLKPAPVLKSAKELAWLLAMEQGMLETALTTGFDWSQPMAAPPQAPDSMAAIADTIEAGARRVVQIVRETPPERLPASVSFFVAPKQIGDVPLPRFLWFMLHDQIHHRGQFSIYLRIAGAKVPSIYGPTADEPWT